jgi:putative oxidoreductase
MNSFLSKMYYPRFGTYLLRWSVSIMMLLHGIAKLFGGVGFIQGKLVAAGVPGFVAYGVLIGEVLAPLFVMSGVFVAPAALVMAINMVVAVLMVHMGDLFLLTKQGGWALELQGLYLVGALAIAFTAKPSK